MRRAIAVAVKDLKATLRNRAAVFWIVVFPLIMLVMFRVTYGTTSFHPDVTVVPEGSRTALAFAHALERSRFHVTTTDDLGKALEDLKKGRTDAVVAFPPGFDRAVLEGEHPRVTLYVNADDPRGYHAVEGALTDALRALRTRITRTVAGHLPPDQARALEAYAEPFGTRVEKVKTVPTGTYQVLAFLAVQALFSAALAAATSVVPEIKARTLARLETTPTSTAEVLLGKYLHAVAIVTAGALLGVLVARSTGVRYTPDPTTWLLFEAATLSSAAVGTLVALTLRDEKATVALINAIAFPSMFLGALVVPDFLVPGTALHAATLYPPVAYMHAAKTHALGRGIHEPARLAAATVLTILALAASVPLAKRV